ncbi:MAG: hypothetical protein A2Y38_08450 [Spirochaetes bacterium GWB1_59_5]|nr:MAG: hypothetical protein A2Y38_08450 [Spirochaetes bacterium GWB1_59_5]
MRDVYPKRKGDGSLFIPLRTEFFDQFRAGTKREEFRPYGPRWNERTCKPGRKVTLSRGYSRDRLKGKVAGFRVDENPIALPGWLECYGEGGKAACIEIEL